MFKKEGFTLAEVLITLGIIGVVASLTIPILQKSIEEAQFKSALKKNYSILSSVYSQIQSDYGSFEGAISTCAPGGDHTCFKNLIKKYVSYSKECNSGATFDKCFPSKIYYRDNTEPVGNSLWANTAGLILSDGTSLNIYLDYNSSFCNIRRGSFTDECGWITIDVNGFKKPNKWGKDIYNFMFYKNKLRATGTQGDNYSCDYRGFGCSAEYLYK